MKVPFLDLKSQYESIRDEVGQALQSVLDRTAFAGGPFVAEFEKHFAEFCGTQHAVGVGSGTDALWLALQALGIGPGDEVITTANTFIATAEAISICGARPVFVDIDQDTFNMDPSLLEDAITSRTKAVIPVHLYGQPADMDPITEVAERHGLAVIEDACQAHGAEYKGRRAGSIGRAGCFSFYPGKNLGAYGEAGAVTTDDGELADRMRMFRDHGQKAKYYHSIVGWNARMDGFQGAILDVKLRHLNDWNDARREHAHSYSRLLRDVEGVVTPGEPGFARSVYHIYAIRVEKRDTLMSDLAEREVSCGIHYPIPLHLQDAYADLGYKKGDFPVTEQCAVQILSLPMYAELTDKHIERVVEQIRECLENRAAAAL